MLYLDVLHRGFHPAKEITRQSRRIYKSDERQAMPEGDGRITVVFISNEEASNSIWRCLGRQLGKQYIPDNFNKLKKQLASSLEETKRFSLLSEMDKRNIQKSPRLDEYLDMEKKLKELEEKIQEKQLEKMKEKHLRNVDQIKNDERNIASVMAEQILAREKEVFVRSILAIRRLEGDRGEAMVEIILEQAYPLMQVEQTYIKERIGEKIFEEKLAAYKQYDKINLISKDSDILLSCHRCLKVLRRFGNIEKCNGENASPEISSTVLTDPFIYNYRVLNENIGNPPAQKFIHPYLTYYLEKNIEKNHSNNKALCNRYYCRKCQQLETQVYENGACKYCIGDCNCFRCSEMDILTKMMAIYLQKNGNWKELSDQFLFQFKSKNLETNRKSFAHNSFNIGEKSKQFIKILSSQGIFLKPSQLKKEDQNKILYLTKQANSFDLRALNYVEKKKRERERIHLQPSRATVREKKQHLIERKNKHKQLLQNIKWETGNTYKEEANVNVNENENEGGKDIFYEDDDS